MSETRSASLCFTVGQCATMACVLEATAAKPGNVHRGADFPDMNYFDFLASGIAIARPMDEAAGKPLGKTILDAIQATRAVVTTNTNLGIVLLLAPLAAVRETTPANVQDVLDAAGLRDTCDVYQAIRLAKPGGLGRRSAEDVASEPTLPLVDAMRLAIGHDSIARQYCTGFADIFEIAEWLTTEVDAGQGLAAAIVRTQLLVLARMPDSLIMRKCGAPLAQEVSDRAAAVLSRGAAHDESYEEGLADFDFWLRCRGNERNPGTTADLLTAALFLLLRQERLSGPFSFYSTASL